MALSLTARHYRTGEAVTVSAADGRFTAFTPQPGADLASLPWIAPGLADLQINGFAGVDFNGDGIDRAAWRHACRRLEANGCTLFLATLITHTDADMARLLGHLQALRAADPLNCAGFHLEGPFLNPDPGTRGAHDPAKMTPADPAAFARWQAAAGGGIRLMTLAPETDPAAALPFIGAVTAGGVRISVGHSMAMGEVLRQAADAGAGAWTHLGNAAPHQAHKFDNVMLHVLAEDRLRGFLIPDGLHVPTHAFKALARALGPRLLLTTDAMCGADAAPGDYVFSGMAVTVHPDRRATLTGTDKLAGATLVPFDGVFRAAAMAGLPWGEMWDAFSVRPAAWIGVAHGLEPGLPADFCLVETEPQPVLRAVYRAGQPAGDAAKD